MTVYWETSRKPLFVKTIWTNGHRHAVLNKEDDVLLHAKRARVKKRRRQLQQSVDETVDNEEFNVPSCRIMISKSPRQPIKPEMKRTYTIDVAPNDTLKLKDFNKEIVFSTNALQPLTAFRIPPKPQSNRSASISPVPKSNSLSERVLVWLDLASPPIKLGYPKQQKLYVFEPEPDNSSESYAEEPVSSEEAVESVVAEPIEHKSVCVKNDAKRQLHIFIPNVVNKSDCASSTLSSSTGTGSDNTTRCVFENN